MSEPKQIIPFGSGSQFADWSDHNCGRCWKSSERAFDNNPTGWSGKRFNCALDKALGEAYLDDGLIPIALAKRLGWTEESPQIKYDCPELETKAPPRKRRAPELKDTPLFGVTPDELNGPRTAKPKDVAPRRR